MAIYEQPPEVRRKERLSAIGKIFGGGLLIIVGVVSVLLLGMLGCPSYGRYQNRMDETNQIQLNSLKIQQTQQLVEVEKQKALVREQEALGIAAAQRTIDATLTDRYLQHEAIEAQKEMANSPNHTTIYIPSGQNGIPIVSTIDPGK